MEAELLKEIIVNLPNFLFSGVAIACLYKITNRLLDNVISTCQEAKEVAKEALHEKD